MARALLAPALALTLPSVVLAGPAEDVERLDRTISALAAAPATVGRLGQLRALVAARGNLDQRMEIANRNGIGSEPPVRGSELDKRIAGAVSLLVVNLESSEDDPANVAEAVEAGLQKIGYTFPKKRSKKAKTPDVIIRTRTELGEPQDEGMFFRVEAVTHFEVIEASRNRVVAKFREIYRDGAAAELDARVRALDGLIKRLDGKVMTRLDRIVKGQPTS